MMSILCYGYFNDDPEARACKAVSRTRRLTVEEVAFDWGLGVKINEGYKDVHFYEGRRCSGTTICRSMEKTGSIVGFKNR
jgi:hypothetical protein